MNLFTAETKRLLARRFTWVMLAVIVGILGMVVLGVALNSQPVTPEALARAEQDADISRADAERFRAECEQAQRDPGGGTGQFPPGLDCAAAFDTSGIDASDYLPYVFTFSDESRILLGVCGGVVALFGFAVGASFVGAEWSTGGMANLLLWRPRRVPLLLTKLGAALTGVLGIGAATALAFLGALWLTARYTGVTGDVTASFWQSLGLTGIRALTLALVTTTVGFALASVGRHTATALGVGVGYLIVGQIGLPVVLSLTEVAKPERYFLSSYVVAWLENGVTMQDFTGCSDAPDGGPCEPVTWAIGMGDAAWLGGVIVAVVLGAAVWQMARRDVT